MKRVYLLAAAVAITLASPAAHAVCPPNQGGGGPGTTSMATENSGAVWITDGCIGVGAVSANNLYGANILQNGDIFVDQRNEGAAVTLSTIGLPVMGPDRWRGQLSASTSGASAATMQRTTASAGLTLVPNALKITAGSVASTTTPSDLQLQIQQSISGQHIADLQWGTANAQPVTYSVVIKSSVAGNYSVAMQNADKTRSYPVNCVVAAGTPVTTCVGTIPGDITGTWTTTPGTVGAIFSVNAACGSGYQQTVTGATSWFTGNYPCTSVQSQLVATANATLELSPIKLERGLASSPGFPLEPASLNSVRLREFYRKTFSPGVVPAGAVGNLGAICTSLNVAPGPALAVNGSFGSTGLTPAGFGGFSNVNGAVPVILQPPMFAAPSVTTYSPGALNSSAWRNVTRSLDIPGSADPTSKGANNVTLVTMAVGRPSAAGDTVCVHAVFDTGM